MNVAVASSPYLSLLNVIRALRGAVGGWGGPGMLSTALMLLLYRRLGQICVKMERLAARFQAGRLSRRGPRSGVAERLAAVERRRGGGDRVWPARFAWLVRIAGYRAVAYGSQLRAVLVEPEMVALLEAAPQAGRILRPLCRMLGVETSLLRPGVVVVTKCADLDGTPVVKPKRVRKKRVPVDLGRIPLPRGVLAWAKRQGFGKV